MGRKDDLHGCTSAASAVRAGAADALEKLRKLVDGLDIAMLTTRLGDGRLLSLVGQALYLAMAAVTRDPGVLSENERMHIASPRP